jgi:hypothetical protein
LLGCGDVAVCLIINDTNMNRSLLVSIDDWKSTRKYEVQALGEECFLEAFIFHAVDETVNEPRFICTNFADDQYIKIVRLGKLALLIGGR